MRVEVPLHAHDLGTGLQDGAAAPTVQRRPRSGSHRGSVAPIDATWPKSDNLDRRPRSGSRRGSVVPVNCSTIGED